MIAIVNERVAHIALARFLGLLVGLAGCNSLQVEPQMGSDAGAGDAADADAGDSVCMDDPRAASGRHRLESRPS